MITLGDIMDAGVGRNRETPIRFMVMNDPPEFVGIEFGSVANDPERGVVIFGEIIMDGDEEEEDDDSE
jgi:hypothetical protein